MAGYRYKPSKPVAVFGLIAGIAMIVLVLTTFKHMPVGFLIVWCLVGGGSILLHLWAAFSKNGSLATFTRMPPGGRIVEDDGDS